LDAYWSQRVQFTQKTLPLGQQERRPQVLAHSVIQKIGTSAIDLEASFLILQEDIVFFASINQGTNLAIRPMVDLDLSSGNIVPATALDFWAKMAGKPAGDLHSSLPGFELR
jgi:hypothetical protein